MKVSVHESHDESGPLISLIHKSKIAECHILNSFLQASEEQTKHLFEWLLHEAQYLFQGSTHPLTKTSGLSPALLYNGLHYSLKLTQEVLPLGVQVSLVGQAALHDVGTVVGAGFDGRQAATVGAVNQLHQGLHTLCTKRNLGRFDRRVCTKNTYFHLRSMWFILGHISSFYPSLHSVGTCGGEFTP